MGEKWEHEFTSQEEKELWKESLTAALRTGQDSSTPEADFRRALLKADLAVKALRARCVQPIPKAYQEV